jgi:putative ABC transport system permease protein
VTERTTEIGTMLSLGTSRWQTLKAFFSEGIFIGFIGGAFSMLFAYTLSLAINHFNIYLPPPPGLSEGYPLMVRNEWRFYGEVFLATVAVAALSTLAPALKATRMKIVDALGHI